MQSTPEQMIIKDESLSLLQKILLTTDGTVTQLLELYSGETIRVRKLEHATVFGGPPALAVSSSEPVLSRKILLCGAQNSYMYAESLLVLSRLSPGTQHLLQQGDVPIGQLWKAEKLENYREVIDYRHEQNKEVAALFGVDTPLLSRSYLIHVNRQPMGLITEKFPQTYFKPETDFKSVAQGDPPPRQM